jgi:hypothetical protein
MNKIPRRSPFKGRQAIPRLPIGLGVMLYHPTGALLVDMAGNRRINFLKYMFLRLIGRRRDALNGWSIVCGVGPCKLKRNAGEGL